MKTKLLLLSILFVLASVQSFGQIVINLGDPHSSEALPTISASDAFANTVSVAGATGNAYWAFDGVPAGGTLSPDGSTMTKDGITFTLPAGADEPVSPASVVNITGGGTATSFGVTLRVTDDDAIGGGLPATTKEVIVSVRSNASVAFVLDRSGSMNSAPVSGGAGITRWEILETSTSLFLTRLNDYQLAGDQACLTYFASQADNPAAAFGASLTDVSGNLANFTGDIGGQSPGGATAMGDGLIAGKNKLEAGPSDRTKVLFLFTDGEQNAGDQVDGGGTQTNGGTPLNNGSNSISIYTIGTGAAADLTAPAGLLYEIANNNGGEAFLLSETSGVEAAINSQSANFFDETFVNILSGASPQVVDRQEGMGTGIVLTHSAPNQGKTHTFSVNKGVEMVGFQVVTVGEDVRIRVLKDGTDVTKFGRNSTGPGYYYYNMRFPNRRVPTMTPDGDWTVTVMAQKGQRYSISCMVDDHALDYTAKGHNGDIIIGQAMNPTVSLSRLDSAITDATITATVFRPGDDVGHLLATLSADMGVGNSVDPGSVGYNKYQALLQQNQDFANAVKLNANQLSLSHQGGGRYSANFTNTDVSGAYQVLFTIEGNHPMLGNFKRTALRSVVVLPPPIDISASNAVVKSGEKVTTINFRPAYMVNGQTRYYGPAWGSYFTVSGNGVSLANMQENPDGSYSLDIAGNPSANMTLNLLGREVYKGKISGFATGGGGEGVLDQLKDWWESLGLPMWLFWVLLILILLLLALFARKKKSS